MHIQKGENYWQSSFACDVSEIKRDLLGREQTLVDLGSKDGLTLFYLRGTYHRWIFLRENKNQKKIIGMIRFGKEKGTPKVGASFITKKYRDKGLGQVLYLGAVHQFGGFKSSGNLGEMSLRMYKKLMKYHNVTVSDWHGRRCRFSWDDDADMPLVNGKALDETYETYYFSVKPYKSA
jgi:hypothetical protein